MLHFACKYGLNNLATAILDTAGAIEALEIVNCENMNPLEIAEKMDNQELVNYIEVYLVSNCVHFLYLCRRKEVDSITTPHYMYYTYGVTVVVSCLDSDI